MNIEVAGQPAVRYETSVCCRRGQLRVKEMRRGVGGEGGVAGGTFQLGINGISWPLLASTARGKGSRIGGDSAGAGL